MLQSKPLWSIGEMCDAYGVTARALRFYEDEALIEPERRGTTRLYSERDRARLSWILRGKRVGLSLADIKQLLDLYDVGDGRETQRVKTIETCQAQAPRLTARGVDYVDAPVSGGEPGARDGTLAIMAGGDNATIDRAEPILKAMGKSIFRTGPLGSGHAAKALNNYVSAAGLAAAVEAVAIGGRFGIDPNTLVDVFNASTGRNNSTENKIKQFVIPESFTSGFSLALMAKDIRTADDLAHQIGVIAPLADEVASLWDGALKELGNAADHTEIGRYLTAKR